MNQKRVMVVYGTRPEAIKMAPLVKELEASSDFDVVTVVTGQHREMLDQVNVLFGIDPHHDLDLMVPGASLADLSSRALSAVSAVMQIEQPDVVVVQGDTSTAFIAALAAFYQQIPVVHLEAGLRTGDLSSPFPEEANRRLTAPLAALHLAPTQTSKDNLLRESVVTTSIAVTGNTVIDALLTTVDVPVSFANDEVAGFVERPAPFVLVTAHRRESWGVPMTNAMRGLRRVAERHPGLRWLVPMHRNPLVRDVLTKELAGLGSVLLTEPLSYHEFAHAMNASHIVLTDSGGVQEEAPSLGKPVLVMRDNTERPEAVDAGTVKLVGTETDAVEAALRGLIEDPVEYAAMANAVNPYGDGRAAPRAVAAIGHLFGLSTRLPDFAPGHQGVKVNV